MRRAAAVVWLALVLTGCKLPTSGPAQLVVGKPQAPTASATPASPTGESPVSPILGGQGVNPTTPNTPLLGPSIDLKNGIDQSSGVIGTGGGNLIGEAGGNLIGQAGGNLTQPPPNSVEPGSNLNTDIGDLVANVPDTDSPLDNGTDSNDADDEESTESDEETAAAYRAID